ncbi:MAG: nitrilase-related carbon-nitrogen hydrolase [Candidatus Micrarchaeia archaeon]
MPEKKVRIGLAQMRMSGDMGENLARAESLVHKAAKKGAQIVCLPELFNAPYFAQYRKEEGMVEKLAEEIPGKTTRFLSECARKNNVVLVGGSIYEKSGTHLYNTSVIFASDGKMMGIYRKTHIPHDPMYFEQDYFERGDSGYKVFDTPFCRIAVLICYDQWFPEAARSAALAGAQIIFYPTAIGTVKNVEQAEGNWQEAWENVMRGHAIANCIPVAASNRVGSEGEMDFWGGSFVCNAFGKTLKRAGKREGVIIAEIDLQHGRDVAEGWRFFYNRRPETYGSITKQK